MSKLQTLKMNDPLNYVGSTYFKTREELVTSFCEGITVGPNNHTFFKGNKVIVLGRDQKTKEYFGFLAECNGTYYGPAKKFFPTFSRPKVIVNGIKPITEIHQIPSSLIGKLTNGGVPVDNREAVASYLQYKDKRTSAIVVVESSFVAAPKHNSLTKMFMRLLETIKTLVRL